MGSAHPLTAPYQAFATADGWINVGAANQANWLRLLDAIGAPELADDARFRDNADRMANLAELEAVLTQHFQSRNTADWLAVFDAVGLPAGPVLSVGEMHADPQVAARDMVVELDHPRAGRTRTIGLPVKLSGTPGSVHRPAPLLGQHTREVLAEIGMAGDEIDRFAAARAAIVAERT
jgi:crotonobetainyl-CoA:carnitine CoA-transferase CaiB-like acyl-CoA transferase